MNKTQIFVNIYRPPSGNIVIFQEHVLRILSSISSERYADLCLLGDFNLDHDPKNASDFVRNLEASINTFGLHQVIKTPTRKTLTTATIIDVTYLKTNHKFDSFVKQIAMSDHYLVGCSKCLHYPSEPTTSFLGRSYRKYNIGIARTYYTSLDKSIIYQLNDVNLVWSTLKGFITNCVKKFCPLRNIVTKLHQPPWITKDIIELVNDKDSAFSEALANKDVTTLNEAKKLRTGVKRAIRNARAAYINKTLDEQRDNPRKFWVEINSLIKRTATKSSINLCNEEGHPLEDSKIPDYINNYFATIGPKLAKNFTPNYQATNNEDPPTLLTDNCLSFDHISQTALLKEIKKICTYKSSGIKDLNSRIIKDAMIIMLPEFTFLCNLSVS